MKSSLNQDTIKKTGTDDVIRIAKKTNYDAIEFAQDKVEAIVAGGGLNGLVRLVKDQGIGIASVQGPEPFNLLSEGDLESTLSRAKVLADVARQVGTDTLVPVASMMQEGLSQEKVDRSSIDSLRRLAKVCGEDIKLGVEFLGFRNCSINTLDKAIRLVDEVNLPNVGVTVDTFHTFISGSNPALLGRLGRDRLFLVHVNDSEPGDLRSLSDSQRVHLGEGVIDLKQFRDELVSTSYDGYVSVELLRPEYWDQNPEEVALRGRKRLRQIFGI